MTFSEYVAFYALTRSEGVVLRYFADAYRALRRTVPTAARTEELTDITSWLGELVRGVDSSLLDEWEALAHPDADELILPATSGEVRPPIAARGISANERGFTVMVRNALFRRVELLAREDYAALGELHGSQGWRADSWDVGDARLLGRVRRRWASARRPGPPRWSSSTGCPTGGTYGRFSTTRRATTTGAVTSRSTWPPPTRPASRS